MASKSNAAARICLSACRQSVRTPRARSSQLLTVPRQAYSTSSARRDAESSEDQSSGRKRSGKSSGTRGLDLPRLRQAVADASTPEMLQQLDELAKEAGFASVDAEIKQTIAKDVAGAADARRLEESIRRIDKGPKPTMGSFWYDEDDAEPDTEEYVERDTVDISPLAYSKLEEIRDMRHYARLAVWDLPLLSKLAKPFEPPKDTQPLRWRYTSYMGEQHPAEKKVVVQFAPADLKLTPVQTEKLKKLAGARYNPETEIVKMSFEGFEHAAQNKSYLSNLIDDLIAAAKDPKDTFEDIPLDTRHHQRKAQKPKFPREWRITPERRTQLDELRQRTALEDLRRAEAGLVVEGQKNIDNNLRAQIAAGSEDESGQQEKVAQLLAASPSHYAMGSKRAKK